jgi:hypothetical protein
VGLNDGITRVDFVIANATSYAGYAENATDGAVTGAGKEMDYSFTAQGDTANFTVTPATGGPNGQIEFDRAWAAFWCKDYGGYCEVQVTVWRGTEGVSKVLKVPLDTDGDQLADRWERDQYGEWVNQYPGDGNWNPLAYTRTGDDEKRDPDAGPAGNGPLVPQLTTGDRIPVSAEYRGFILDGGWGSDGKLHPGGHKRLSTARKEGLWEVDHEANLAGLPPAGGAPSGLHRMLNDASFIWARGTGNLIYYIIQQTDLPPRNWNATDNDVTAGFNMRKYLLDNRAIPGRTDFVQDALKKYFTHMIVLSDTPGGFYRTAAAWTFDETKVTIERDARGSYFLTAYMNTLATSPRLGVSVTGYGAVAFAQEYMHMVISPQQGVRPWDTGEHLMAQADPSSVELMGANPSVNNRQLITVRIGAITQALIDFKNNPALAP